MSSQVVVTNKQELLEVIDQNKGKVDSIKVIEQDEELKDDFQFKPYQPKWFAKALATNLGTKYTTVRDVIQQLNEIGYSIQKTNPENPNSQYSLTEQECIAVADYILKDTFKSKRANGEQSKAKIIVVTLNKGGSGKTSTCSSLASVSHFDFKNQPRTLLIDGDHQGSLNHLSNEKVDQEATTYTDLMKKALSMTREERLSDEMQSEFRRELQAMMIPHKLSSVMILPTKSLDKLFLVYATQAMINSGSMANARNEVMTVFTDTVIRPLEMLFDQIIVDTNPEINILNVMYLHSATNVIVPVSGRSNDIFSYKEFDTVMSLLIKQYMPDDCNVYDIRTLITMNKKQPEAINEMAMEVHSKVSCFSQIINYSKAYESASRHRVPLQYLEPSSAVNGAIKVLDNVYLGYKSFLGWK